MVADKAHRDTAKHRRNGGVEQELREGYDNAHRSDSQVEQILPQPEWVCTRFD